MNRLGLGPFGADISAHELRRAGLRAMGEVVSRLGVQDARHVIFGHTHRAGPLPGESEGWWLPGGARLTNTGSWIYERRVRGRRRAGEPLLAGTGDLARRRRAAQDPGLLSRLIWSGGSPSVGMTPIAPDELRRRAAEVRWFHSIDLGGGIVTPGLDCDPRRLEQMSLPADLSGRTVLDIGAWDGFYSFEAERRGAAARARHGQLLLDGPRRGDREAGASTSPARPSGRRSPTARST